MPLNRSFGALLRTRKLFRHSPSRLLVVPLDHSVADGPIASAAGLGRLVGELADNDVDAVVLHKGTLRHLDPEPFTRTSLIVHLSASTMHAPDPDAKYLVTDVENALRLGADAVSVHVNVGSASEARQLGDLAVVADACDRWNVPLLAMMYPRGPGIADSRDAALVLHVATLAADLGADLVKVPCPRSTADLADVVGGCPVPLIVAGGENTASDEELLDRVADMLDAGVTGLAMGRNIFQAPEPGKRARDVASLVHAERHTYPGSDLRLTAAKS
ncbi:2-amino-3,7-dideoxy-D-threo-hept-6-ulosonate synthase [Streptomyces sp. SID3212]|uniref:2-amino-3,7-dideoxy-D-threo-hept-6-ulosonate synthase n=1 Tax=unclassified Streptomyces TaxID=2593676 RepID=UPI00136B6ADC|nr:2-amino-3,7-dideoxy-D-threo-hept-6-ulosonate synthase [Streptomyces sp. SID3212]MYV53649.1 2-amino-4,5-dihydroxy-6-one-heptanoic acid-7-phosphate synthase [Streptomyces sp. SID3212]